MQQHGPETGDTQHWDSLFGKGLHFNRGEALTEAVTKPRRMFTGESLTTEGTPHTLNSSFPADAKKEQHCHPRNAKHSAPFAFPAVPLSMEERRGKTGQRTRKLRARDSVVYI